MQVDLGWMVAAFLGGFLVALWLRGKRHALRENFARVEWFRGRGYREIRKIAGVRPSCVLRQGDGSTVRIWSEEGYEISLAFDGRDVCLGVVDERVDDE